MNKNGRTQPGGGRSCALSPGEVFLVLDGAEPEVDLQLGLDLEAAGARPPATRGLHSQWSNVVHCLGFRYKVILLILMRAHCRFGSKLPWKDLVYGYFQVFMAHEISLPQTLMTFN